MSSTRRRSINQIKCCLPLTFLSRSLPCHLPKVFQCFAMKEGKCYEYYCKELKWVLRDMEIEIERIFHIKWIICTQIWKGSSIFLHKMSNLEISKKMDLDKPAPRSETVMLWYEQDLTFSSNLLSIRKRGNMYDGPWWKKKGLYVGKLKSPEFWETSLSIKPVNNFGRFSNGLGSVWWTLLTQ